MSSSATLALPIADLLDGGDVLATIEDHTELDALREDAAQRLAYGSHLFGHLGRGLQHVLVATR